LSIRSIHCGARDEGSVAPRQRLHIMVGNLEQRTFQVYEVARDMEGKDLPRSVNGHLVTKTKPLRISVAHGRPIAFPHQISMRLKYPGFERQGKKCFRSASSSAARFSNFR
jgi:hypothetical protein